MHYEAAWWWFELFIQSGLAGCNDFSREAARSFTMRMTSARPTKVIEHHIIRNTAARNIVYRSLLTRCPVEADIASAFMDTGRWWLLPRRRATPLYRKKKRTWKSRLSARLSPAYEWAALIAWGKELSASRWDARCVIDWYSARQHLRDILMLSSARTKFWRYSLIYSPYGRARRRQPPSNGISRAHTMLASCRFRYWWWVLGLIRVTQAFHSFIF